VEKIAEPRGLLPQIAAGLSLGAVFIAVVGIALQASSELGLTDAETSVWIMVAYGLPSLLALLLAGRYRQPLMTTGNIFIIIFVLSLGGELTWPELVGATMVAGIVVLVLGATGLTSRLAGVLPPPIVYGLLAGAVLTLFASMFTALGFSTLLVGTTLAAYFVSRAALGDRIPALLTALVVGVLMAIITSETGPLPDPSWPQVTATLPQFTVKAIVTATPVLVVFIALQANAPSIVFLRSQGYDPPERTVSLVSGLGTVVGSFFGPMGVSLSLPASALVAGPEAGAHESRYRASYVAGVIGLLVAMTAGFATDLIEFIPTVLLDAIVGLAVLGVLAQSLKEITRGPLLLGPLVAFGVSVSNMELLGLGRFFWALTLGIAVSLILERSAWHSFVEPDAEPALGPQGMQ
jgi:benzoate membrane transport protein